MQALRTGAMNDAGSDADDATEGEFGDWESYRVQPRDAYGDEFDVRNAHTVLWLEDGTLHDLTDPDGEAEALYFDRNEDIHTAEVRAFYRLDNGNWLTITASFNDGGELLTVNGDDYDSD